KLTDFGLAKDDTADTGMTMEGAVIGTLDFMPPEQRQGAEFTDHRSDLWSLAATFYQMLTGKSPKVINISSIPPRLQAVVAKALEESKEERFQSAMEMREAIIQSHSGKMDTTRPLGEGECPQCATLNPPQGKFCIECSQVLQVECLKCKVDIQIWNKGCGECGAQQQPLIEKKIKQLQKKHDDAEQCLQELKFQEAETAASVIAAVEDSRLQKFEVWHEEFSQRLVDTRTTKYQRLKELLEEANTHEETFDYDAARRSLNKVDKRLKDHELEKLGSAKSNGKIITTVLARIKKLSTANETVKEKAVSFLEEFDFDKAIETARGIKTDEHPHLKEYDAWFDEFVKDVQDEREAVSEQRQTQLEIARDYLDTYDYDAAISALDLIPIPVRVGDAETLREDCKNKRIELSELQKEIKDAVRMNVLSDVLYLLPKVQRAMELHVGSEDLAALRNKLETGERERQKQTRKVFVDAEKLLDEGKARDADELLQRMPANSFDAGQMLRVHSISDCANAEEHLVETISKASEDGVIDAIELLQILDAVQDVTSFAPTHRNAIRVESELISRLKAAPEKHSPQIGALDLKNLDKIWAYFPSNYRPYLNYKAQTRLKEIRQRIFKLVGNEFKLDSPKQLRKILFEDLGFPVIKKTASGEASTSGPVLRKLSKMNVGELPGLIIRYREIGRLAITHKFASSNLDIVDLPTSTLVKLN
ncbi:MAG TPA: hypothetical protein EYG51_13445, partial [Pseudomonadales bacterium]|nr:hypothetical protein [Pseudomonadales bacterium]